MKDILQKKSSDKIYINSGNEDVLKLIAEPYRIILDVGCGSGSLDHILTANGHSVDGITISPAEYEEAKQHQRRTFIHNLEMGLPAEVLQVQYDYVVCSHVLEHIVYPQKLLKDIYKGLKVGGHLIVALPNIMHYKSRMKLMGGKFDYADAGIWDNTHVKWYTFSSAKQLLIEYGFTIELATVTGELPFNSLFSKIIPPIIRKVIFSLLLKISKGFFGYQLLFKVRKS